MKTSVGCLPVYLSDSLLHGGLGDKAIDHHLPVLTDTMGSAESLEEWKGTVSGEDVKVNS